MPNVKGKLGSKLFGKKLIGWLASADPKSQLPRVARLEFQNKRNVTIKADLERKDLKDKGINGGFAGFALILSNDDLANLPAEFSVALFDNESNVLVDKVNYQNPVYDKKNSVKSATPSKTGDKAKSNSKSDSDSKTEKSVKAAPAKKVDGNTNTDATKKSDVTKKTAEATNNNKKVISAGFKGSAGINLESAISKLVRSMSSQDLIKHYELCSKSSFFDPVWYSKEYALDSSVDPVMHYLALGGKQGFNPSKFFDSKYYLNNNPDVKHSGICPLVHYEMTGKKEKRKFNFNEQEYLFIHSDVCKAKANPVEHFLKHGLEEKRSTNYWIHKAKRDESKQTILLIGHELSNTGAPHSLKIIAKGLLSLGYNVDIWVFYTRGRIEDIYNDIDANVFYVPRDVSLFPNVLDYIKSYSYVFLNTVVVNSYAKLCRDNNIPHLWMIREDISMLNRYIEQFHCGDFLYDESENIVCVSEHAKENCSSLFDLNKVRVFRNCVEDNYTSLLPVYRPHPDVRVFTICGTINNRKGFDVCINAFLKLNLSLVGKWKLQIIGKKANNYEEYYEFLKNITKGYSNIEWIDEVSGAHKWDVFMNTDVFLVPSLYESCSRIVLEAAMLSKPCIMTHNVGAKYVAPDNSVFIVAPGDSDALHDSILQTLKYSDSELAEIGKQFRKKYLETSTFEIYRGVIADFVKKGIKPARKYNIFIEDLYGDLPYVEKNEDIIFSDISFEKYSKIPKLGLTAKEDLSKKTDEKLTYIIVPIYNGFVHITKLIPSLVKNTVGKHKFIFINDCSTDENVNEYLRTYVKSLSDCIYIENEVNLGFVRTVNKAATYTEDCNFILLNSDTEVPYDWMRRLIAPLANEDIASVTPMSNGAGIFSFPYLNNDRLNTDFLGHVGLENINKALRVNDTYSYVDIPTAHGFSMAISKKVWKQIGGFNEFLFGRGYGEENDWSRRAIREGFRNVLIHNLYVAHYHGGSFTSEESKNNKARSSSFLKFLYPEYKLSTNSYLHKYHSRTPIFLALLGILKNDGYKVNYCSSFEEYSVNSMEKNGVYMYKNGNNEIEISLRLNSLSCTVTSVSEEDFQILSECLNG
ncbi:glycosyltransferase [Ruminobacter sp. RM87]|uniref:glycosyltransferase n=1 Tax=Ruminobacter sp. RM87 TaxID=1200567 RepID=UPI0004E23351|nr:glycosyltransferase [Ruminobacter sp. RM87]